MLSIPFLSLSKGRGRDRSLFIMIVQNKLWNPCTFKKSCPKYVKIKDLFLRKKFSERYKFVKVRDTFQIESIDEGLKNRLWNTIRLFYFEPICNEGMGFFDEETHSFAKKIYDVFFKTHEEIGTEVYQFENALKERYFKLMWFEIYDLLEYISVTHHCKKTNKDFRTSVNRVLENEMSEKITGSECNY